MRSFVIHDDYRNNKEVGRLYYDEASKRLSMTIDNRIDPAVLPLSLEMFTVLGRYELGHEDTLRWIRTRVCPPNRHNIREILSACGLTEYDEFGILMYTMGHSDKDGLYLEELS